MKCPDAWLVTRLPCPPLLYSVCLWLALLKETVIKLMWAKTSFFSLHFSQSCLSHVNLLVRSYTACVCVCGLTKSMFICLIFLWLDKDVWDWKCVQKRIVLPAYFRSVKRFCCFIISVEKVCCKYSYVLIFLILLSVCSHLCRELKTQMHKDAFLFIYFWKTKSLCWGLR